LQNTWIKPTKGFWQALEDVDPDITYIVSPLSDKYPLKDNVWVTGLDEISGELEKF
jgi:hypothetical protein